MDKSIPFPAEIATDARAAPEHPRSRERDPEAERRRKLRMNGFYLLIVIVIALEIVVAFLGENGFMDRRRLAHEHARRQQEVEVQRARVATLEAEVEALRTTSYARERIAREQLEMVAPGEISFLLPLEPKTGEPGAPPPPPPP